ncbi:c-type cytochrome domain-containing protein, partial [Acetobacter lovaniensis]|uniref:c-type cytochrome domain-containing protein n=1 Tax=Acetobacter lovaniensis TaxID=104100 RepID=UPI0037702BBD
MRLDLKAQAFLGGNSGAAIVAGKSAESRLIHYVAGINDVVMPPEGERLNP